MRKFSWMYKCFWTGHDLIDRYDIHKKICLICNRFDDYKTHLGVKIISTIKSILTLICVGIGISGLFLALLATISPFMYLECVQFAHQNNIQFVYKFFYGCMVNYNGHWISPDKLIQFLK